jgi:ABC-type phosphate/phosphonate transport system ATPase subunit
MADKTPTYISRHVLQLNDGQHHLAKPIESFRHLEAYVLLGEPGSGKSMLFRQEVVALGGRALSDGARLSADGYR